MGKLNVENFYDDVYKSRVQEKLDKLKGKLKEDAGNVKVDDLDAEVERIGGPDPKSFNQLIERYAQMALQLGGSAEWDKSIEKAIADVPDHTVGSWAKSARDEVAQWKGDGPDAFVNDFIHYFETDGPAVSKQRLVLNAYQALAEAHQAIYARAREDMENLFESGYAALEANSKDEVMFTLWIFAAVGTFMAGPGGWSLLAASTTLTASVVGADTPDTGEDEFQSCCAFDAHSATWRILGTIEEKAQSKIDDVKKAVNEINDWLAVSSNLKEVAGPIVLKDDGYAPIVYDGDGGLSELDKDYQDTFTPPS